MKKTLIALITIAGISLGTSTSAQAGYMTCSTWLGTTTCYWNNY